MESAIKKKKPAQLMTTREIAEILRLHQNTIGKMCDEGVWECNKVGKTWRIVRASFEEWFREEFGQELA